MKRKDWALVYANLFAAVCGVCFFGMLAGGSRYGMNLPDVVAAEATRILTGIFCVGGAICFVLSLIYYTLTDTKDQADKTEDGILRNIVLLRLARSWIWGDRHIEAKNKSPKPRDPPPLPVILTPVEEPHGTTDELPH